MAKPPTQRANDDAANAAALENGRQLYPSAQWGQGQKAKIQVTYTVPTQIANASSGWFGPQQPLVPVAPQTPESGVVGRRFDYPTGYNLQQRPRPYDAVGFKDLRALSRNCEVMRLVIETRKDQLCSMPWALRVKAKPGEDRRRLKASPEQQNRIFKITEFMQSPDQELDFEQWTRAFLEDHFVIDAPVVYKRLDRKGDLYALELIDGSTISPLLDATGRRPMAPQPAYQQILKGVPATDYTTDELYYMARNVSTDKVYGYSPVEQVLVTANIAIRRATFQLEYYTKGSQPDAFLGLPESWTIDQIKVFQDWLDSLKAQRRVLRAVPGKFAYQPTKEPQLKDEYDDYLNRIICFAFSVTPTALVKMMNRAQSESQHDQAIEEGAGPTMRWYENFWTKILAREFESPDLEFAFIDEEVIDPKEQSEVDTAYVKAGIYAIDEIRDARGKDPLGGVAAQPMVFTSNGYVTIGANVPVELGGDKQPEPEPQPVDPATGLPVPGAQPSKPKAPKKDGQPAPKVKDQPAPPKDKQPAKKLAKLHKKGFKYLAPASAKRSLIVSAKATLATKVGKLLSEMGKHAALQLRTLVKAEEPDPEEVAKKLAADLDLSLMGLVATTTQEEAARIAKSSGYEALISIGLGDNDDLVGQVSEAAVDYAKERAAWLAGKRLLDDGSLIDNPSVEYSLEETTRSSLRDLIADYLERGEAMSDLAEAIQGDYAFSEERAHMIAATEVANANSAGALAGYKKAEAAGVTVMKVWSVTDDLCCDDCEANEAIGPIPLDDVFPSGDDAPLAHPNCRCVLLTALPEDGSEGDEGND